MKMRSQILWMGGLLLALLVVLLSPFFSGLTLLPADTIKSLPLSRFGQEQMFQHGHIPQWIPYLFGGMPCYGSIMVTPSYLISIILSWGFALALPILRDPVILHIFHLVLLGCGTFLYLRRRELSWVAAGFVALTLALGTTLTGLMGAGHTIKLWTVCWMPLNLYWLERLLTERRLKNLPVAAICLAMMLTLRHVQMSWYFLLFAGIYTLARLWQMRSAEGRPWLGGGLRALTWVGLALLLAAFLYLPVLEYTGMSMRGGSQAAVAEGTYAGAYSFPVSDLITWWIPGARGFGGGDYWGALEYTAFPLYAGALWLPLLLVAFWRKEDRARLWPWLLPSLFLLLLGLGKNSPLYPLFVDHLPGYAKLRAHMWALAVTQMGLVFGAGLGLDRLIGLALPAAKAMAKPARVVFGVSLGMLGLALLCFLGSPNPERPLSPGDSYRHPQDELRVQYMFMQQGMEARPEQMDLVLDRFRAARAHDLWMDAARTLLLAGLAGLGLGLLLIGRIPIIGLAVWLGLLTAVDLIPMDRRTLNFEPRRNPEALFRARGALAELTALPDKHTFRVWPEGVYGTNELAWHGLHSIDGYHGAKLAGIQRVLTEGLVEVQSPAGPLRSLHPTWLNLLNVQYSISRQVAPWLQPLGQFPDGYLLQNPQALPRLSFPRRWEAVPGEDQFQRVMTDLDPRELAVLDPAPVGLPAGLSPAEGRIISYDPDRIEYSITSSGPALALMSEVWLPKGWIATLNGSKVPILRADHLLRSVALPAAGDHKLVLEYKPAGWVWGRWISLVTLLGLLLARFGWRRHPHHDVQKVARG